MFVEFPVSLIEPEQACELAQALILTAGIVRQRRVQPVTALLPLNLAQAFSMDGVNATDASADGLTSAHVTISEVASDANTITFTNSGDGGFFPYGNPNVPQPWGPSDIKAWITGPGQNDETRPEQKSRSGVENTKSIAVTYRLMQDGAQIASVTLQPGQALIQSFTAPGASDVTVLSDAPGSLVFVCTGNIFVTIGAVNVAPQP